MVAPRALVSYRTQEVPRFDLKTSDHLHFTTADQPRALASVASCKSCGMEPVPEIDELPLLDDDSIFEDVASVYQTHPEECKPKPQRFHSVKFQNTPDHPLSECAVNIKGFDTPLFKIKSNRSKKYHNTKQELRFPFISLNNRSVNRAVEPSKCEVERKGVNTKIPEPNENSNDGTTELVEFNRKHVQLSIPPNRRFLRPNSEYLRMFVAEKQMFYSGKLARLSCGPFITPREDNTRKEPAELLGISYKWNKPPIRRTWVQLN